MPIAHYLAMTAVEMAGKSAFPGPLAWMACHFSLYDKGLSNLPRWLPPGSVLILDDSTPIEDHDPQRITASLRECMERLECAALLLDFQRPQAQQIQTLVAYLCSSLPFPLAVSETYAENLECGVFVSPIPLDESMASRLTRWRGREIWLDTSLEGLELILTKDGVKEMPLSSWEYPETGLEDRKLHCHYRISLRENSAVFTLWRTIADVCAQLDEAQTLGVTSAIGLYQEFKSPLPELEEGLS